MKKTSMLALAAFAFAFLACDDAGTNPAPTPPNVGGCKVLAKISTAEGVFIAQDVEEWAEMQISSGKNDTIGVTISDVQEPRYDTPLPANHCSGSSTGELECEVNGVRMTFEEQSEYMENWRIGNPPIYRELVIPGEIAFDGEGYRRYWITFITASEIEEFVQSYTDISISLGAWKGLEDDPVPETDPAGGDGDNEVPPLLDNGGPRCP